MAQTHNELVRPEFNMVDIFELIRDYASERDNLDENSQSFVRNIDENFDNPSWPRVIAFLNRHIVKDEYGHEHSLRMVLCVKDQRDPNNITRPFIVTHYTTMEQVLTWLRYASNIYLRPHEMVERMEGMYGAYIRMSARHEGHNSAGLIRAVQSERVYNFESLCRYISVVAPNVYLSVGTLIRNERRDTPFSDIFRVSWNTDFVGDVSVVSYGKEEKFRFTSEEDVKDTTPVKAANPIDDFLFKGLLNHHRLPTDKFYDALQKGQIIYNGE